jgi:putative membrane protein
MLTEFLLVLFFALLGTSFGVLTGLLPGIHTNSVAFILLGLSPFLFLKFQFLQSYGVSLSFIALLVACMVVACSLADTFLDFLPAAFLGAPDEDTALSLLPGHAMLLEGRAYEASVLSAIGSWGAVVFGFAFLLPFRFIIGEPLNFYFLLRDYLAFVLIGISLLLILTDRRRVPVAAFIFLLSGIFGLVIIDFPLSSPFSLPATSLFPALTGLFGLPALIFSATKLPDIPEQEIKFPEVERKETTLSIFSGSTFGSLMGFLPGVTSAQATVLSMLARKNKGNEQVIVTLSSVNTANSFFVLVSLFLILRPRSGAMVVASQLIEVEAWNSLLLPSSLLHLLLAVLVSATISYFAVIYLGKKFAGFFTRVPYRSLNIFIIAFLVLLVWVFTGIYGLLILATATSIGSLPLIFGARRAHCMGVLLLPVILKLM